MSAWAWNFDSYPSIEDYAKVSSSVLKLDSKLSWVAGVYHYCQNNPKNWQDMGSLVVTTKEYPPEIFAQNITLWREHVRCLFENSAQKKQEILKSLVLREDTPPLERTPSPTPIRLSRSTSSGLLSTEEETLAMLEREARQRQLRWTSPKKKTKPLVEKPEGLGREFLRLTQ